MRASSLVRSAAVAASFLAASVLMPPAGADPPIPPILPTSSPTPSPQSTQEPRSQPTTQPAPRPRPAARPRPPRGPAPTPWDGPVSDAIAAWRNLPKTPARTTTALLELLQRLQPPGAPLDQAAIIRGVRRFPVAGYVWYQDDWMAPRFQPYFHTHEGNDLFAVDGTPVVACADGVISKLMTGSIGGVSIWLRANDGTVYYYGHLRSYAPGLVQGMPVRAGQPIATIGNTGLAVDTYPHLHFEVHPGGALPVNPKPALDAWLFEAETMAARAIEAAEAALASVRIGAARWRTLLGLLAEPAPERPALWAAALNPAAATELLTVHAMDRIALESDLAINAPAELPQPHDAGRLSPVVQAGGLLSIHGH